MRYILLVLTVAAVCLSPLTYASLSGTTDVTDVGPAEESLGCTGDAKGHEMTDCALEADAAEDADANAGYSRTKSDITFYGLLVGWTSMILLLGKKEDT